MQTPSPIKNPQEVPKIVENIPKSDNKKEKALKRVKTIRTSQINPVLRIEPGEYQIHVIPYFSLYLTFLNKMSFKRLSLFFNSFLLKKPVVYRIQN